VKRRTFDEMITFFNQTVADMNIARKYKMELLGMIIAIKQKHDEDIGERRQLPSEQPKPQWIPISEREPEFGNYLTTFREKATGKVDVAIDLYWSGGWDDDGDKFETLAWMPLPEPWRGEGHGE